ncbi:MAG: ATP-dependent Clp protease proteolytic subunit [Planctomycetes bacterium]|nr:ATP-dependent Clp protease proteolytic subunit [Planctomycetota bacterium]
MIRKVLPFIFISAFICLSLFAGDAQKAESEGKAPAENSKEIMAKTDWTGKVLVIPIKGEIRSFSQLPVDIKNAFERAEQEPPRLIVVELDSPGGEVETCGNLSELILKCNVPTVTLVLKNAISGGAMLAISCDEIEMLQGSRIGDIQPMLYGPGGNIQIDERLEEKIESYVRVIVASHAEASGYSPNILRAMVSRDIELYKIEFDDGGVEFMPKRELEIFEENVKVGIEKRKIVSRKLVCEEGQLLALTPKEAVEYGLAKRVLTDRRQFYDLRNIPQEDIVTADISEGKFELPDIDLEIDTATILLLVLFLVIGIAGVVTEAHAPGFGIPGAIGIIGFASFFVVLVLQGHAQWYEIALFLIGLALLIVEIVVIPGFGVAGVSGLLCIIAGMFLAFMPEFDAANSDILWNQAAAFVLLFGASIACSCILVWFVVHFGAKLPFLSKFFLKTSLKSGADVLADVKQSTNTVEEETKHDPNAVYVGKTGVAETPLRPAGKMLLDNGNRIDVVAIQGYIDINVRVKVVETRMNRIVVDIDRNAVSKDNPDSE